MSYSGTDTPAASVAGGSPTGTQLVEGIVCGSAALRFVYVGGIGSQCGSVFHRRQRLIRWNVDFMCLLAEQSGAGALAAVMR